VRGAAKLDLHHVEGHPSPVDPPVHLVCYSCRYEWLADAASPCPKCGQPTVTTDKRKGERRAPREEGGSK
jgi:hypothetical protein